jgi:hypothetical protein
VTGPRPGEVATPEVLAAWVLALAPAPALPAGPRVVAVDGRSGAGKTTLARSVADAVGRHRASAVVVHLDDLYPGWDGLDPVVAVVVEHLLAPLAGVLPDADVRRRRALGRDGDTYAPHWDRWSAQEEAYAARERPRERAGLVLDTSGEGPVLVR